MKWLMPSSLRFSLISLYNSVMCHTGVDFSKIRSLVITVALTVKNDLLLSSGISLKSLTRATIPASFQSWSKAPRIVLSFAPSDRLFALTHTIITLFALSTYHYYIVAKFNS